MGHENRSLKLGAQVYKLEFNAFKRVCEAVATPRSLACYLLAKHDEWDQYLALSMPDRDSPSFADDYLVTQAMRKNPRLPNLVIDRKAKAIEKWYDAENACRATNERLQCYREGRNSFDPWLEDVLTSARSHIAVILGPLTAEKLSYAESKFRFGPGATSSCSGRDVLPSRKMVSRFDVTPGLYPYWRSILAGALGASVSTVSLRHYNTVQFVPKDSTIDRAISIEPHMNIFVQLGIGALIRRELMRHGLNLDTMADANRLRASRAHLEKEATIDLSSASDTICRELVWLLLPPHWCALLDTARTGWSKVGDTMVKLEKFSAMGNGFTFELESLIFTALARACGDPGAQAFGDDIIMSQDSAPKLMATLSLLGFSVNEKKTFLAGRFFESCGADYHDGHNVRPFYFRGEFNDYTSAVIRIANKIRMYAHRRNGSFGCDIRFLSAWLYVISRDSAAKQTGVPIDHGDDGLVRNFDEACPSAARHGFCGYLAKVWRARAIKSVRTHLLGAYLCALHAGTPGANAEVRRSRVGRRFDVEPSSERMPKGIPFAGVFPPSELCGEPALYRVRWTSRSDESVRGATGKAAFGRQLVMSWPEPGPWC